MGNAKPARVVLITGASSGIGKATACAFARADWTVVMADIDGERGRRAAEEIKGGPAPVLFVQCDVADEASVGALIDRVVAEFGRLDAAFNNAGVEGISANTAESGTEDFDRVISINLRGVWLCMRAEIRQMLRQPGGAIVNCSSVAGLIGLPALSAYVASKHGVIGLTKAAALEYAKAGIRVNAVCPGAIETPMLERYMAATEGGREQMIAAEPIGRIGNPAEVANAVLWLCDDAASFVTGQAIAVDGGWTAG